MSDRTNPDRIGFEIQTGPAQGRWEESPSDRPFRILVMGDFSNRGGIASSDRSGGRIADRQPVRVDRDDVDRVLAAMAPSVELPVPGGVGGEGDRSLVLRFSELDDFHPDRLWARVPEFQMLQQLRDQVAGGRPAKRPAPAESGRGAAPEASPGVAPRSPAGGSLLDRIIGDEAGAGTSADPGAEGSGRADPGAVASAEGDLQDFVNRAMAGDAVFEATAEERARLSELDDLATRAMRAVLHHPRFQGLESLWRAVDFMARRVETGAEMQIHLLDLTRHELLEDQSAADLEETDLFRLIVEGTVGSLGEEPWSLLVAAYTFGGSDDDVPLLARLAGLGRRAAAPWLAGAHPRLAGARSFTDLADPETWSGDAVSHWATLRRHPAASSLGLVLPRFLLRPPYGADSAPCEAFDFEEISDDGGREAEGQAHADYLWGNPVFAAAVLLAEAFAEAGWSMRPERHLELAGLPLHLYRSGPEALVKPCAEVWFRERAAARVLDRGIMPLVSMKDSDTVRLVRLQSVADPPSGLAGGWA
jgi:type VI secretion system protein ImpC